MWALDRLRKEDDVEWKQQQEEDERLGQEEGSGGLSAQRDGKHNKKQIQQRRHTKVEGKRRLELHSEWINAKLKEME